MGPHSLEIIIPVKVADPHLLDGFCECYLALEESLNELGLPITIRIIDDSPGPVFHYLSERFRKSSITHVSPSRNLFSGRNNKLNSVEFAVNSTTADYILLLDDDCRPSASVLASLQLEIGHYDCFRCIVTFDKYRLVDLLNLCGIYVINSTCADKQFWGNLGFRVSTLREVGFPSKDSLYDELAIYRKFSKGGKVHGYLSHVAIEMTACHNLRLYLRQRVRYAYENMAYPLRFGFSLAVVPIVMALSASQIASVCTSIITISLVLTCIAFIGQRRYRTHSHPRYAFLLAPLWFLPYTFTSWFALACFFLGGITFGGEKIRRVA